MLENTCGNCPKLNITDMCGLKLAGCKETGFVVPHTAKLKNGNRGDKTEFVFTRIPLVCPRDESEVRKSEKPAATKHWVTKTL